MISFVLPVYEVPFFVKSLNEFVLFLKENFESFEVIIVDDGSRDAMINDIEILEHCMVLRNRINKGKGYSVRKGMIQAAGQIIVFMDGDFPFHFSSVKALIHNLSVAGVDVVIGDRTLPLSRYPLQKTSLRQVGSTILSSLVGRRLLRGYFDTQCGLKAFRYEAAKKIFSRTTINRYSFDLEVLYLAHKLKLNVEKVPVVVESNPCSHVRPVLDGLLTIIALGKIWCYFILGKYRLHEKGSK